MFLTEPNPPSLHNILIGAAFFYEVTPYHWYEILLDVNGSRIAYRQRITLDGTVDWSPHGHDCPSAFRQSAYFLSGQIFLQYPHSAVEGLVDVKAARWTDDIDRC